MKRLRLLKTFLLICIWGQLLIAQDDKQYRVHTIGFYNLENLFDTVNDPQKNDEASPIMELKGNREAIYAKKVKNMASVVAYIGRDVTGNSPALLGVAEIENRAVLVDLVNDPLLIGKDYGIIHFDSPDGRGIDVGLIYQKALFRPISESSHELKIYDDQNRNRIRTRDQLLVSGYLEDDLIHVIVNHWPSRRGGEARSRPKRVAAAKLAKRLVDSLQSIDPYAKIIIMGDLNDNPNNASLKMGLNAKGNRDKVGFKDIYNPYETMYKKGLGTTGYRDSWFLFDQILVTQPLLQDDYSSFRYYNAGIFNKTYLTNSSGRYKGYPYRSFANGSFIGGYSDHYPAYMYLIREVSK
ncbi:MAG: endonuclease/exonuclease/phosphatase family protein [Bacteroidota bacterium]